MFDIYKVKQLNFEESKSTIVEYFTRRLDADTFAKVKTKEEGGTFKVEMITVCESLHEAEDW